MKCGGFSGVGLSKYAHASVPGGNALAHRQGFIARSVIHHDDLQFTSVVTIEYRMQGLLYDLILVVRSDQHTHRGPASHLHGRPFAKSSLLSPCEEGEQQ